MQGEDSNSAISWLRLCGTILKQFKHNLSHRHFDEFDVSSIWSSLTIAWLYVDRWPEGNWTWPEIQFDFLRIGNLWIKDSSCESPIRLTCRTVPTPKSPSSRAFLRSSSTSKSSGGCIHLLNSLHLCPFGSSCQSLANIWHCNRASESKAESWITILSMKIGPIHGL